MLQTNSLPLVEASGVFVAQSPLYNFSIDSFEQNLRSLPTFWRRVITSNGNPLANARPSTVLLWDMLTRQENPERQKKFYVAAKSNMDRVCADIGYRINDLKGVGLINDDQANHLNQRLLKPLSRSDALTQFLKSPERFVTAIRNVAQVSIDDSAALNSIKKDLAELQEISCRLNGTLPEAINTVNASSSEDRTRYSAIVRSIEGVLYRALVANPEAFIGPGVSINQDYASAFELMPILHLESGHFDACLITGHKLAQWTYPDETRVRDRFPFDQVRFRSVHQLDPQCSLGNSSLGLHEPAAASIQAELGGLPAIKSKLESIMSAIPRPRSFASYVAACEREGLKVTTLLQNEGRSLAGLVYSLGSTTKKSSFFGKQFTAKGLKQAGIGYSSEEDYAVGLRCKKTAKETMGIDPVRSGLSVNSVAQSLPAHITDSPQSPASAECFNGFDLKQFKYNLSELGPVWRAVIDRMSQDTGKGLFVPIPLVTGYGKTYISAGIMILKCILNAVKGEGAGTDEDYPIAVYFADKTSQRDLFLPEIDKVLARFQDSDLLSREQAEFVKRRTLAIPNYAASIMEAGRVKGGFESIQDFLKAKRGIAPKEVEEALDAINKIEKEFSQVQILAEHRDDLNPEKEINERCGFAYRDLANTFRTIFDHDEEQFSHDLLNVNPVLRGCVLSLYPGFCISLGLSDIISTVAMKFLHNIQLLKGNMPFYSRQNMLVVIDEFDAMEKPFFRYLADIQSKRQIDLFKAFTSLAAHINSNTLSKSPLWDSARRLAEKTKRKIDDVIKRHDIKAVARFCADDWAGGDGFSDVLMSNFTDTAGYIHSRSYSAQYNAASNHNSVKRVKRTVGDTSLRKSSEDNLFHDAERVINEFAHGCVAAGRKYAAEKRSRYLPGVSSAAARPTKNTSAGADDEFHALNVLEMLIPDSGEQLKAAVKSVLESRKIRVRVQRKDTLVDGYHDNGFNLVDIRADGVDHLIQAKIAGFRVTPAALLESIVRNSNFVLALSATVEIESVPSNFPITHIQERLKSAYSQLSEKEMKDINEHYRTRFDYKGHLEQGSLKIESSVVDQKSFTPENYLHLLIGEHNPYVEHAIEKLRDALRGGGDSKDYQLREMLSVVAAAKEAFLKGARCHLSISTKGHSLKGNEGGALKELIQRVMEHHGIKCWPVSVVTNDLNGAGGKKLKEQISNEVASGSQVMLLTAYATIERGINLGCPASSYPPSEIIDIDPDGSRSVDVDFDSLFLTKRTHLHGIENNKDDKTFRESVLHRCFSLNDAGFFNYKSAMNQAKGLLQGVKPDGTPGEQASSSIKRYTKFYRKECAHDYRMALLASLAQSIGRITRGPIKKRLIQIRVASDLAKDITGLTDSQVNAVLRMKTFEMQSALQACREYAPPVVSDSSEMKASKNKAKSRARRAFKLTQRYLNDIEMAKELAEEARHNSRDQGLVEFDPFDPSSFEATGSWKRLGAYVLRHPTGSLEGIEDVDFDGDVHFNVEQFGWAGAGGSPVYRFSTSNLETVSDLKFLTETEDSVVHSDELSGEFSRDVVVSYENSILPTVTQNSVVAAYFHKMEYALEWSPGNYSMTPTVYTNIYRPRVSEEAVKAVLENEGLDIHEMPPEHFEEFDFCVTRAGGHPSRSPCILIDVKEWSGYLTKTEEENKKDRDKIAAKLERVAESGIMPKHLPGSVLLIRAVKEPEVLAGGSDIINHRFNGKDYKIIQYRGLICRDTGLIDKLRTTEIVRLVGDMGFD